MALKNRSETSDVIQALPAVVGETEFKEQQDDNFAQNVVFRKDVSAADTAAAATKTLDFLDIDYIEVTQSNNVVYTLNNVQQGEIKFLKITKTAAQTISFAVGTDVSIRKAFINATTIVIYRVTNKDGNLYIESINIDNDISGEYVEKEVDMPDWDMNADLLKSFAHGLTAAQSKTIIIIGITIRNDVNAVFADFLGQVSSVDITKRAGYTGAISTTTITVGITAGVLWNVSVEYNDGADWSRGKILIKYIP